MRAGRWLPWIAPPLTVVLILAIGQRVAGLRNEPRPPGPGFSVTAEVPPAETEIAIGLKRPDGTPAAGAVAILLEPSLSYAVAGADGVAHLPHLGDAHFRLQAYLPGHALLSPAPFALPPRDGFRFAPLDPQELHPPVPIERITRRVSLRRGGVAAEPLSRALVVAVPTDRELEVPWASLSGADGEAILDGTRPVPLRLQVYAPRLPRDAAWLLAEEPIAAEAGITQECVLEVEWADLALANLPADQVLRGSRLDRSARLPMRRIPADGSLSLQGLPAGRYRFEVGERRLEADLVNGSNALDFRAAVLVPEPRGKTSQGS